MASRGKPKRIRGEAKRDAILSAAWEVFREVGFAQASMDEITRRAGGSKMSVYAHFGGKDALFEAVVRWRAEIVARSYSVAAKPIKGIEKTVTALATAIFTGITSGDVQDLHRVALSALPAGKEIGTLLYEHGTLRVIRGAAAVLKGHMESGELAADNPMAAAEALFGLLLGIGYIRFALGVPEPYSPRYKQQHIRRAVRIFLAAYRPVSSR